MPPNCLPLPLPLPLPFTTCAPTCAPTCARACSPSRTPLDPVRHNNKGANNHITWNTTQPTASSGILDPRPNFFPPTTRLPPPDFRSTGESTEFLF